jgi:dUTP pyrophosphatase
MMFQKPELILTKVGIVKDPGRKHISDAGIDFFVPDDFPETIVYPQNSILIDSKIRAVVPDGYALIAFNKSGVCTQTGLACGAAVIDSEYRGNIHFHLINTSTIPVIVKPGQKILQFLLIPVLTDTPVFISAEEYEEKYSDTARGAGGFGSTGLF